MPGAPGVPGAAGGNGQSPFSGAKSDGADAVAKEFYDKLMAGEANGATDLYSTKAKGHAKAFRDGKATESVIEEYKAAFAKVKFNSSMARGAMHIVLLVAGDAANQQTQAPPGAGTGQRNRAHKKLPPGMKVQFTIVSEHGKFVIQEVAVRDH